MDTLMRMQASYDIARTRKREKQIHVRRIHQVAPFTREEPACAAVAIRASEASNVLARFGESRPWRFAN